MSRREGRHGGRVDARNGDGDDEVTSVIQTHGVSARPYELSLVDEARAGSVAAFTTLFDQYHGPITGYLYRITGDRDAADDLAQDTFIKAYHALGRTDADLNFRAWIYRIATNTAHSWGRRRRLLTWLPFGVGGSTAEPSAGSPQLESLGERELVDAALRRISPAHASALLLRHHQRLTLEETAEALGVSVNTAKVRLYRARKAFVQTYQTLNHEPGSQEDQR